MIYAKVKTDTLKRAGLAFDQSRVSYKKGMALSQVLLKIGDPTGNRTPLVLKIGLHKSLAASFIILRI
jgi:hypothetical protein